MDRDFATKFVAIADEQVTGAGTTPAAASFRNSLGEEIDSLEITYSFGKGRATNVPWIGFLGYDQKTTQGIYPAFLYYKDHRILFLAYGVSETNPPIVTWANSGRLQSVEDYFIVNGFGPPPKYGNSFVFKAYTDTSALNDEEIWTDLIELFVKYHKNFSKDVTDEFAQVVEVEGIDSEVKLMEKPFDPALIKIDSTFPSIDILLKRINQPVPEIDLNTEHYFQRKDDLWDVQKQSRLIESVLIRFPLPAFYFDGSDHNRWLVVDGLQRLSSFRNFVIRKTLKLTNLEFLTQLEGLGWDDLNRNLQRTIEETQVVAYIINPGTPADVKFNIFKRINTGGLILEPQEIRHALNQGIPATFVAELADLEEFREATTHSISPKRMLDRDFVTRFLSFFLVGYQNYTPDLDTFMSKGMAKIKDLSISERADCRESFRKSMITNHEIFGPHAFRKIDAYSLKYRRNPLNKALFEVMSVTIARIDDRQREKLVERREQVVAKLVDLIEEDSSFLTSISSSTGDKGRVIYRFDKIAELLYNTLRND